MAAPTTIRGTKIYVKISDGASPEVFAHPCLINAARGISFTSNSGDIIVPDCTNPDDPAWRQVIKDGLRASISGAGVLDNVLATVQFYDLWFRGDAAKNVQVYLGTIGKWAGAFKLTSWQLNGERNNLAQVSLTMESDGIVAAFAA